MKYHTKIISSAFFLTHRQFAFITSMVLLIGCRTISPLERDRPLTYSREQITRQSAKQWVEFKNQYPETGEAIIKAQMSSVLNRLRVAVSEHAEPWEIHVYDNGPLNAFFLPPRNFAFHVKLCYALDSEDERAALAAHLLGHANAEHSSERLGSLLHKETVSDNAIQSRLGKLIKMAYAGHTEGFLPHPYSIQQETVADTLAALYMARAGYDPSALLSAWSKIEEAFDDVPVFRLIHPMTPKRRGELELLLKH